MSNHSQLDPLTNRQQDICSYAGVFGALLALTCLIQHIMITRSHWIVFMLTAFYIFIIIAFVLFAFQQYYSPLLLIISAALSMTAEFILMKNFVFSLVVLLLFLYCVVIVVVVYTEQLPRLLKQKYLAKKAEENEWRGKL